MPWLSTEPGLRTPPRPTQKWYTPLSMAPKSMVTVPPGENTWVGKASSRATICQSWSVSLRNSTTPLLSGVKVTEDGCSAPSKVTTTVSGAGAVVELGSVAVVVVVLVTAAVVRVEAVEVVGAWARRGRSRRGARRAQYGDAHQGPGHSPHRDSLRPPCSGAFPFG